MITAPTFDATSSTSAANGLTSGASKAGMDYDSFLKLLVAEMSNQDPLNPTASTEYVAQFAAFSNVEQAIQTNKKLESLMSISALSAAGSLVGREAFSADGSVGGSIAAVRVVEGGLAAVLEDGSLLPIAEGTTIR